MALFLRSSIVWLMLLAGCQTTAGTIAGSTRAAPGTELAVAGILDALHQRAAAADFSGYFALFHDDAVFMGTDRQEYWPLAEFKAYTKARFAAGQGWTYVPTERFIHQRGAVVWFEERLLHERYGETRGTGVLVRDAGQWRISQYNLTLPIPNDLFVRYAKEIFNHYRR